MTDLLRRVERLEQRVEALRTPEARRVVIGDRIGETEAEARERLGIDAGERILFVAVEDASG
jgi:hypothetical protein